MINLVIGNSLCRVEGISVSQFKLLRTCCAYTIQSKRKFKVKNKKGKMVWSHKKERHNLMDRSGVFPTGLLYLVKEFLDDKSWEYRVLDERIVPRLNQISETSLYVKKSFEPYSEQIEAAEKALGYGRGILVSPTGTGKSAIIELICDILRVNTLIVVPRLGLKSQLTKSLRAAFGHDVVGPLGKSTSPKFPITVENVDALDPKKKLTGFDCVITDEFHHSGAVTYRNLNFKSWSDIYFKFGLTATPFRSNSDERLLLESVLSQVIYDLPYEIAVERKRIVPMQAYYIDMPKEKKKLAFVDYHEAYAHFVVNNDLRNNIIADMASNLIRAGASTVILTKQIDHGNILRDLLEERGHTVPFAEGRSEVKEDDIAAFNNREEICLIGTCGVLGEGVDTKPCEYVILAGGGKSKNQFMQMVGRAFRNFEGKESCKVILVRDSNNKHQLEHFNSCVQYLKIEYGVDVEKLDLGM